MQTTLLGLAIAFIIALVAALIGPYFIDWDQFRPQFETEATRVVGAPVRVGGKLDARLLPTPSLRLRAVVVGKLSSLTVNHSYVRKGPTGTAKNHWFLLEVSCFTWASASPVTRFCWASNSAICDAYCDFSLSISASVSDST